MRPPPLLPGIGDVTWPEEGSHTDGSLCILTEFLPHCHGKQKSVTGWQRSSYFKDKILGPNSQSRQTLTPSKPT